MDRISRARRAARLAVPAALLGAVLAGCTKKVTITDPRFTVPEGRPVSGALLLTYPNVPVHQSLYKDKDGNSQQAAHAPAVAARPASASQGPSSDPSAPPSSSGTGSPSSASPAKPTAATYTSTGRRCGAPISCLMAGSRAAA